MFQSCKDEMHWIHAYFGIWFNQTAIWSKDSVILICLTDLLVRCFSSFSFSVHLLLPWPNILHLQKFPSFWSPFFVSSTKVIFSYPNIFLLFLCHSFSPTRKKYFPSPFFIFFTRNVFSLLSSCQGQYGKGSQKICVFAINSENWGWQRTLWSRGFS